MMNNKSIVVAALLLVATSNVQAENCDMTKMDADLGKDQWQKLEKCTGDANWPFAKLEAAPDRKQSVAMCTTCKETFATLNASSALPTCHLVFKDGTDVTMKWLINEALRGCAVIDAMKKATGMDTASNATAKASSMAGEVADKAANITNQVIDKAANITKKAGSIAGEIADKANDLASKAGSLAKDLLNKSETSNDTSATATADANATNSTGADATKKEGSGSKKNGVSSVSVSALLATLCLVTAAYFN